MTVHTGSYSVGQGPGNILTITGTTTAGEMIQGMNFVFGIGDEQSAGLPLITAVDLDGIGTVFNGNANPPTFPTFPPPGFVVVGGTTTISGFVDPAGVLGFVTVDTTGVTPGVYDLKLKKDFGFPQNSFNFTPTVPVYDLGTLTVTPEPTPIVLGLFAVTALCAVAIRRHRQRARNAA